MRIEVSNNPWQQAAALSIRLKVFVQERGLNKQDEFDGGDTEQTVYAVAWQDERTPVATVRFQQVDEQTMRPGRVATLPEYRGQGTAQRALLATEKYGQSFGMIHSVIHSELTAQGFYERCGYQVSSTPFIEDGVECIELTKKIDKV
ncbi:GNAT family N-acetyltransferase [Paucilactobacillus suebicus]|uniref:N-acetyltransferase GCN5 n=1 Tax=Paucilactobacillus suebicus DSM 5007 = KCTC 3549 TaxID=1423807 RepID=A0A0R1W0L6_9LACO|nr:GNAT family N-acetyltransferase [Paucilactobacillus suebicus]KRM11416.1 N-acetyltransferase GCN5 [Paucilactobacillus suebicus DSM 5007 = KCTC 3549]